MKAISALLLSGALAAPVLASQPAPPDNTCPSPIAASVVGREDVRLESKRNAAPGARTGARELPPSQAARGADIAINKPGIQRAEGNVASTAAGANQTTPASPATATAVINTSRSNVKNQRSANAESDCSKHDQSHEVHELEK